MTAHIPPLPSRSAPSPDHGAVTLTADPETGKVNAAPADGAILPPPDNTTNDTIWKAIVFTSCYLVCAIGTALVVGMFLPLGGGVTPPEVTILFSLVFGFLSGLLARNAMSRSS